MEAATEEYRDGERRRGGNEEEEGEHNTEEGKGKGRSGEEGSFYTGVRETAIV